MQAPPSDDLAEDENEDILHCIKLPEYRRCTLRA